MSDLLQFERVSKIYGHGRAAVPALRDASFGAGRGELVIVMGPSGSGKSTLLMIAGALLSPTRGVVKINGTDLGRRTQRQLAQIRLRDIGFVFQSFNLFATLSALENVALPASLAGVSRRQRLERAASLLDHLGLGQRLKHVPEELSGGEKQRVAVARALINDPSVVLADEPTANLDSATGHHILELLQTIAKDDRRTVLVVTHDPRIIDSADRLLTLEDGRLQEVAGGLEAPPELLSFREGDRAARRDGDSRQRSTGSREAEPWEGAMVRSVPQSPGLPVSLPPKGTVPHLPEP